MINVLDPKLWMADCFVCCKSVFDVDCRYTVATVAASATARYRRNCEVSRLALNKKRNRVCGSYV